MKSRRLRDLIHASDPYARFDVSGYGLDLQGWGSEALQFAELIAAKRPRAILEVGTWKGPYEFRDYKWTLRKPAASFNP